MALIKCSECSRDVSDKAKICPNCGNPIAIDNTVKISFPKNPNHIFNIGCNVYDEEGNTLAKCKQGETVEFVIEKDIEISVKMSGYFGKPSINVIPGGRYSVNIRPLGGIAISKVDNII